MLAGTSLAAYGRRWLARLRLPVVAVLSAAALVATVAALANSIGPSGGGDDPPGDEVEVVIPECEDTPVFGCQLGAPLARGRGGPLATGRLGDTLVVAAGGPDGTVRAWDIGTRRLLHTIRAHIEAVTNLAIAELDGDPVVVSAMHEHPTGWEDADRELALWDLRTGRAVAAPYTGYAGFATRIAIREFRGTPMLVATNSHTGGVRVWRLGAGELAEDMPPLWEFRLDGASARTIELADVGGSPVVVVVVDEAIRLIDPVTGSPATEPLAGHSAPVTSIQVGELAGRPVVVSGGDDRTVRAWDLASGDPVGKACEAESVWAVQLSTAYRADLVAVVRGRNAPVTLCDVTSGEILAQLPASHPGMPSLAIGELDGALVGVSAGPDRIRVWNLEPGPDITPRHTP